MNTFIDTIDEKLIAYSKRLTWPLARISLFVVYFWFGILKVFGESPASPLIEQLMQKTIPFMPLDVFMILFGIFEMGIGTLFLVRGKERVAICFFILHLITTTLPLLFVPQATWSAPFIPTLEGQYIIKNLALLAIVLSLGSAIVPWKDRSQ